MDLNNTEAALLQMRCFFIISRISFGPWNSLTSSSLFFHLISLSLKMVAFGWNWHPPIMRMSSTLSRVRLSSLVSKFIICFEKFESDCFWERCPLSILKLLLFNDLKFLRWLLSDFWFQNSSKNLEQLETLESRKLLWVWTASCLCLLGLNITFSCTVSEVGFVFSSIVKSLWPFKSAVLNMSLCILCFLIVLSASLLFFWFKNGKKGCISVELFEISLMKSSVSSSLVFGDSSNLNPAFCLNWKFLRDNLGLAACECNEDDLIWYFELTSMSLFVFMIFTNSDPFIKLASSASSWSSVVTISSLPELNDMDTPKING